MTILKSEWIASHTMSLWYTMPQQVDHFSWRSLRRKVTLSRDQLLWAVQWGRLSGLPSRLEMSVQNVSSNWLGLPATWDYMPAPDRNQIVFAQTNWTGSTWMSHLDQVELLVCSRKWPLPPRNFLSNKSVICRGNPYVNNAKEDLSFFMIMSRLSTRASYFLSTSESYI